MKKSEQSNLEISKKPEPNDSGVNSSQQNLLNNNSFLDISGFSSQKSETKEEE